MAMTYIPATTLSGRSLLRTDLTTLTEVNVREDLKRLLPQHAYNRDQIRKLQEYQRGWHPAIQARVKTTRTDVDNTITVNYAQSITRDIVGYFLGKPIQYTNREGKFRKQMENLINVLSAENKQLVDYQIAEDCSICGVGYRGVFTEPKPTNGTKLKLLRLDPIDTFVVYSSDPTQPAAYAVTSYETTETVGRTTFYKVYTSNAMYSFKDTILNGTDPLTGGDLVRSAPPAQISFGGG